MTFEEEKQQVEKEFREQGFRYMQGSVHMEFTNLRKIEWGKPEDGQSPEVFCAHFGCGAGGDEVRLFGRMFRNAKTGRLCTGEWEVWLKPELCGRV